MVIPVGERYGKLKEVLLEYVDIIANIRRTNPALIEQQQSLFFFLVFPWLADYDQLSLPQRIFWNVEKFKSPNLNLMVNGQRNTSGNSCERQAPRRMLSECDAFG